jgi:hypothetical protein
MIHSFQKLTFAAAVLCTLAGCACFGSGDKASAPAPVARHPWMQAPPAHVATTPVPVPAAAPLPTAPVFPGLPAAPKTPVAAAPARSTSGFAEYLDDSACMHHASDCQGKPRWDAATSGDARAN